MGDLSPGSVRFVGRPGAGGGPGSLGAEGGVFGGGRESATAAAVGAGGRRCGREGGGGGGGGGPIGDAPAPDRVTCPGSLAGAGAGMDPAERLVSFVPPSGRECTCLSSLRRIASRTAVPAGRGGTGGDCAGGSARFFRGERWTRVQPLSRSGPPALSGPSGDV